MNENPNYTHLKNKINTDRWVLLQGGTRSGKTYSVLEFIIAHCIQYRDAKLEIDIVRNTFKLVRSTTWKDMEDLLRKYNLYHEANHNKTEHIYSLFSNKIYYYGADDPDKAHGRKRDIIFLNECNQIEEDTIDQISPRTTYRIIADYNPAIGDDHWLDRYIDKYPPLITTYKDNPFLTAEQIVDIESKKGKKYWWSVYGQGKRAKREGVIFEKWEYGDFDTSLPFYYGLDFGFVNDPDACVKVAIDESKETIYLHEVFYDYGNTINEIAAKVRDLPRAQIVADSAEQRLIEHLTSKCQRGVRPVKKGPGSVLNGIRLMENYKIVITRESRNLKTELNNYSWSDKGKEAPIDDWNHCIDAVRYVVYTYSNRIHKQHDPIDNDQTKWNRGESTGFKAQSW